MITSGVAALRRTVVEYVYLSGQTMVRVTKNDGEYIDISMATFNSLYHRFDGSLAGFKEDCIRYAVYHQNREFVNYPEWFINAYDNGYIYEEEGYDDFIMYFRYGDIVLEDGGIVLCNFKDEVTYMQFDEFDSYYETVGADNEDSR